jgi:hypothetical protein
MQDDYHEGGQSRQPAPYEGHAKECQPHVEHRLEIERLKKALDEIVKHTTSPKISRDCQPEQALALALAMTEKANRIATKALKGEE